MTISDTNKLLIKYDSQREAERRRAYHRKRADAKLDAEVESGALRTRYSRKYKERILREHGANCFLCPRDLYGGKETRIVYHAHRSGKESISNLYALCSVCYENTGGRGIAVSLQERLADIERKLEIMPVQRKIIKEKLEIMRRRGVMM